MTAPRVLFVDDDAQMRHSTAQALRLAGFQVEALAGGEEALAFLFDGDLNLLRLECFVDAREDEVDHLQ